MSESEVGAFVHGIRACFTDLEVCALFPPLLFCLSPSSLLSGATRDPAQERTFSSPLFLSPSRSPCPPLPRLTGRRLEEGLRWPLRAI
jgi:hypothetical protein